MDMEALIAHKRKPFRARLDEFRGFLDAEIQKGSMLGRIGRPPVGPVQQYEDPGTGKTVEVLVFGSNSYLGLSNEPELKEHVKRVIDDWGLGEGGSPAFSGYMVQQRELEAKLAQLSGHEDAIVVAGGYVANLVWITGLMGKNDVIVYDKNSHASTLDAIHMAGLSHAFYFNTDSPESYRRALDAASKKYPDSQIFVTVEGVRSIDGQVADLPTLVAITREYGDRVTFVLDDAHGLGILGPRGRGTLEHFDMLGQVDIRMSTCSKALGIQGAFLTGPASMISYIRTMASPYAFTTAMSQPVLATISGALDFLDQHPERIQQLHQNKAYMQDRLERLGFTIYRCPSGIIPIFIKGAPCDLINKELFYEGLFANVFSYPAVSPGMERIRLSMMATHTQEHLDRAIDIIERVGRRHGIIQ